MKRSLNHTRRFFLQGIGGGTIATIVTGQLSSAGQSMNTVQFRRSRLPVLRNADVIVAGGSVAGVAAALQFARAGRKVVIVEHRNYLGREVSATLKPWVDLGKLAGSREAPEL